MTTPDDLFSTPASAATSTTSAQKEASPDGDRYILPKDIANSVSHLSDRDLGILLQACLDEKKKRGGNATELPIKRASQRARKVAVTAAPLTTAQVSAVRAAFKAGVRPPAIARQFRISLSQVRAALSSGNQDDHRH